MNLYIDTTNREKIIVGLDQKMFETDARQEKSQKLLPFIADLLQKQGCDISDITAIKVNTGPGSFTGLRVGIAIANALGWALKVPVNGKKISQKQVIEPTY